MTDLSERSDRLREARLARGFDTAKAAADFLRVPYGTYSGHENGSRGIKDADLLRYSSAFRVPAAWLAYGTYVEHRKISVIGSICDVGEKSIVPSDSMSEPKTITPPFTLVTDASAVSIDTEKYQPVLFKNDVLLIGSATTAENLVGKRVVIKLDNYFHAGTLLSQEKQDFCHFQSFDGSVFLNIKPELISPIIGIVFQSETDAAPQ